MRIAPTRIFLDVNTSPEAQTDVWLEVANMARRTPTRDSATRHPCLQADFSSLVLRAPLMSVSCTSPDPVGTTTLTIAALT
jgi:hypothetical protein